LALEYGNINNVSHSAMSVRFSGDGQRLLALRRRKPPVLFELNSPEPTVEFDHPGYYNSCTMKSCSFGGLNDEFVLSGSDDFNLYGWRVPQQVSTKFVSRAQMILRGHRSIVNQVRFSSALCMVASAGVEKVVKLWSPYPLSGGGGGLERVAPHLSKGRQLYSREDYVRMTIESGTVLAHEYSTESTSENRRMIAFFDSLVQREVEGSSSSTDDDDDDWYSLPELENIVEPPATTLMDAAEHNEEENDTDIKTAGAHRPTISSLIARRRRRLAEERRKRRNEARLKGREHMGRRDPRFLARSLSRARWLTRLTSSSEDESEHDLNREESDDGPNTDLRTMDDQRMKVSGVISAPDSREVNGFNGSVEVPTALVMPPPFVNHDSIRAALHQAEEELATSSVDQQPSTSSGERPQFKKRQHLTKRNYRTVSEDSD